MKKFFHLLALTILFVFSSACKAQSLESKISALLETKFKPKNPGGVFLVAKEGKAIYRKAFGEANLEFDIAMQPEYIFEIGSMTKQFTAVSILLLMEQGKLRLDDEITKFIPDYPTHGSKITIHHLLTHTSGIKNFTSIKGLKDISKKDLTPLQLIDFFKNEPIDFAPGEQFKYNNSGYVILGHIIESVSGQTYGEFVEKNIFEKTGMTASSYGSHEKIIKNRVSGYHDRDGLVNNDYISLSLPYASGSIMSNVDDMLKWQIALSNHSLVKQKTIEKAFTNYTLNNGEKINYGYGWHLKDVDGVPDFEHGGSIFGFKSMAVYVPSKQIYVIGLSNCDCNSPTEITKQIAAMVVESYK